MRITPETVVVEVPEAVEPMEAKVDRVVQGRQDTMLQKQVIH